MRRLRTFWLPAALALALPVTGCTGADEQSIDDASEISEESRSPGCLARLSQRPAARQAGVDEDQAEALAAIRASLLSPVDVTFQVTVPANTPADAEFFVAGDFQGWDPASPTFRLTRQSIGRYAITVPVEDGSLIEFKLTRGSWGTVEKDSRSNELDNRRFQVAGPETAEITVASWADTTPARPRTIAGDIDEMTVEGFLDGRRVWVYLPPGYATDTDDCYPVLYMFDGQNVFDSSTAFLGNEWGVDETLSGLMAGGAMQKVIVVAVDNGGGARLDEYTPWRDPEYGGGHADAHLEAISDVLIPYINDNFRTMIGSRNTGIAGSSLGGLMSLYAAYNQPDTFGRIGALSPSLWWDDQHMRDFIAAAEKPGSLVYMDMGTVEGSDQDRNGISDSLEHMRTVRDVLIDQGFVPGEDLATVEDPGAGHNEAAWSRRMPDVLRFMFPPR